MRRVSFLYFLGVHFTSVSVTVIVSQEGFRVRRVSFLIYLFFFFRKVRITSVSVTITVSQEGFRVRRVSFFYIYFFI